MLKLTNNYIRENNETVHTFKANIKQLLSLSFSDNYICINKGLLQYNMTAHIEFIFFNIYQHKKILVQIKEFYNIIV